MNLKDFIPPIIYFRLKRSSPRPVSSSVPNIFPSYQDAETACGRYDDDEIVEIVREKTKQFLVNKNTTVDSRQTVQNILVLQSIRSGTEKISVLEPGGACGALYFQLMDFFPGLIKQWIVVETPKMAGAGAKFFPDNCLSFTSSMPEALKSISGRDLCIASGVIQYMPDPLSTLDGIFSSGFEHIYITRQPVIAGSADPIISFQETSLLDHGPGSLSVQRANKKKKTPVTYLSESHFHDQINKHGYSVVYNFEESPPVPVQFEKAAVHIKTIGLFLKKNK